MFKNTRAQKCPDHNCTCKLCDTTMLRVVWIPNDAPLSIYFYPFPSLHQYFRYLPPYIQNFSSSIANNGEKITTKTPYQIRHVESKMFWDNTIPIHEEGLTRMVMWWSPPSWAREKVLVVLSYQVFFSNTACLIATIHNIRMRYEAFIFSSTILFIYYLLVYLCAAILLF